MKPNKILSLLAVLWAFAASTFADSIPPRILLLNPNSPYEVLAEQDSLIQKKYVLSVRDTLQHEEQWQVEIQNLDWRRTQDKLVIFNLGYVSVRDLATGKELWKKKNSNGPILPVYLNDSVLVAYKMQNSQLLRGYSLTTGKAVWKKLLDPSVGWSYIDPINEDSAWVAADNLYRFNWLTGKADKFSIKSGFTDSKNAIKFILTSTVLGVMSLGISGGNMYMYLIPMASRNTAAPHTSNTLLPVYPDNMYIAGTLSNLVNAGGLHYIADRDDLSCFDDSLNLVWRYDFPARRGSSSYLELRGDTLLMVNTGRAIREGNPDYATGIPFTAAFNAKTGAAYWYKELSEEKRIMKDYHFEGDDSLIINFDNETIRQSLLDGNYESHPSGE